MKLQTGDILLVDTEGVVASTIDVFQGNDFNHAGFVVVFDYGTYVFEAIPSGVAFTPFEEYHKKFIECKVNLLILRPKYYNWEFISDELLMKFILPLTNRFYGYDNLFLGQVIRYVTKWFGRERWLGQTKSTKTFICGKLVAYIYNYFFGAFDNNWWMLAPANIYDNNEFDKIKYTLKQ